MKKVFNTLNDIDRYTSKRVRKLKVKTPAGLQAKRRRENPLLQSIAAKKQRDKAEIEKKAFRKDRLANVTAFCNGLSDAQAGMILWYRFNISVTGKSCATVRQQLAVRLNDRASIDLNTVLGYCETKAFESTMK